MCLNPLYLFECFVFICYRFIGRSRQDNFFPFLIQEDRSHRRMIGAF